MRERIHIVVDNKVLSFTVSSKVASAVATMLKEVMLQGADYCYSETYKGYKVAIVEDEEYKKKMKEYAKRCAHTQNEGAYDE